MLQTGFKTAEETISMMISTVKDHIATTLLSSMYLKKKMKTQIILAIHTIKSGTSILRAVQNILCGTQNEGPKISGMELDSTTFLVLSENGYNAFLFAFTSVCTTVTTLKKQMHVGSKVSLVIILRDSYTLIILSISVLCK